MADPTWAARGTADRQTGLSAPHLTRAAGGTADRQTGLSAPHLTRAAGGTADRQTGLSTPLRGLHRAILTYFLAHGGPPGWPWLEPEAIRHGLDPRAARADLAAVDLVHLDDTGQVAVAYPFSGTPSQHRVCLEGHPPLWAMCAIDALGIPQMVSTDGVITGTDPHAGEPVRVEVRGGRWSWQPRKTAVLTAGYASAGGSSAACSCPHMIFVTSRSHARGYLAAHPGLTGEVLGQRAAIKYAGELFGPLLADPA